MELRGAGALVTGGASGLGAATARRLAASGAVVTVADLPQSRGAELAAELGGGARFAACDVTDGAALAAAVALAAEAAPLRVLVTCAGIGPPARVVGRDGAPMPMEGFERVVRVNLLGTFDAVRQAAARMVANPPDAGGERGVIVCTASIAAWEGQIGQAAYAASKGGIVAMTLPLARDLSREGVRVVTVAPGLMDTPLLAGLPEPARQALAAGIPFPQRLGRPEEFAGLVEHIVANGYLNGEVVRLDGALRMPPR